MIYFVQIQFPYPEIVQMNHCQRRRRRKPFKPEKTEMAQWSSDSGILRKNKPKENYEDLLVFGYACKLFRDDEKALYIDQGKHLIPWMADESLKIDRYDCRGALSDLRSFEASREGFDAMRWLGLSESERKLEQLCDEERYYSLHINEEEEEMYKEEEAKRVKTNAFQYNYDVPNATEEGPQETPTVQASEEEEEYVPAPALDVPVDINLPKTVKEYARIEKTAFFIFKQGLQMEILIKAKQADNPQFSFLNQGDPLYKFYRHVLAFFKSGRYAGIYVQKTEDKKEEKQDSECGDHYLHPSLLSANNQPDGQSSTASPTVPYKPSANCAYSQLVNRIQGNLGEVKQERPTEEALPNSAQMSYEQQQQYYQYYYVNQYFEYYKHVAQLQQNEPNQPVPSPPDFQLDPSMQTYFQQLAYNQYLQQQQSQASTNNSYAQIVSNLNKDSTNPYTANIPSVPQLESEKKKEESSQVILKKPLLSLAAYGSGSEEETEDEDSKEVFKAPTGETQKVIDKMAVYVSKNGEKFEEIVKAKGDPRFEFLNASHEYNKYYRQKIKELKDEETRANEMKLVKEEVMEKAAALKERILRDEKKKVIAPVCFSIRKPKEEPPKEIKSALPLEESDEEEGISETSQDGSQTTANGNKENVQVNIELPKKVEEDGEGDKKNRMIDNDDPILEMIDLTDDSEERKDAKRAEDRIKDKLAAAAREKLSSANRDKALQLERKKRAAAFLKLKSAQLPGSEGDVEKRETVVKDSDSGSEKSLSKKSLRRSCSKDKSSVERSISKERSRSRERRHRSEKSRNRDKERRRTRSRDREKRSRTPKRDKVVNVESDEEESKRKKKSSKKKKSHKRKHSKTKHSSRSKKSKKRYRRSSSSSISSRDSQ